MKLAVFATHPIQYHVPMWRSLAQKPGMDVTVYYFSDHSVRGGIDPGFGVKVVWDVPLLEGYTSHFISRSADLSRPSRVSVPNARQLLKDGGFDCVLIRGYTHRFERQVVEAAKSLGIRTVLAGEFTDNRKRSRMKSLLRDVYLSWFYRHIDAFCYIGEEARRHLARKGIPPSRLFYSPYSVDTQLFKAQVMKYDRTASRAALKIAEDHFVLIFSGKLVQGKAPMLIMDAIEKVQTREKIALIILGEGPLKEQLIARGTALLGERLHMPGFVNQNDLGRYFTAADVFVQPSESETWGLVVNEAMQFGLPAIVSDRVGCHHDLVIPDKTGAVFSVGSADELGRIFQRFQHAPEFVKQMGLNAKEHIKGFTTEASVRGILAATGAAAPEFCSDK